MKNLTLKLQARRIFKKQGSIMIIVLVVMASLLALVTGLLYTVKSERATLVDDVSQEQVYQMTASANNLVFDYLDIYFGTVNRETELDGMGNELIDKIVDVGEEWLADAAKSDPHEFGFEEKQFTRRLALTDIEDEAVYKYITKIEIADVVNDNPDEPDTKYYYFNVITNGVYKNKQNSWNYDDSVTITRQLMLKEYSKPTVTKTDGIEDDQKYYVVAFGTTGGPSPAEVGGPKISHTTYFGNDESIWGASSQFNSAMSTFGSFRTMDGMQFGTTDKVTLNIRKNFIHQNTEGVFPRGGVARIGGYFKNEKYTTGGATANDKTVLYILGQETTLTSAKNDWYGNYPPVPTVFVPGGDWMAMRDNVIVFLNGDFTYTHSSPPGTVFYINGNLTIPPYSTDLDGVTFYVSGDVTVDVEFVGGSAFNSFTNAKIYFGRNLKLPRFEKALQDEIDVIDAYDLDARYGEISYSQQLILQQAEKDACKPKYYNCMMNSNVFIHADGTAYAAYEESLSSGQAQVAFMYGTDEAWPFEREDDDFEVSLFPNRQINGEDFETVQECFYTLCQETIEKSFSINGEQEFVDTISGRLTTEPLNSRDERNIPIFLSRKLSIADIVLSQSDTASLDRFRITAELTREAGATSAGFRYEFIDAVEDPSDSGIFKAEPRSDTVTAAKNLLTYSSGYMEDRLSPKIFPSWDIQDILVNKKDLSDEYELTLTNEYKIDINRSYADAEGNNNPTIFISDSGYINSVLIQDYSIPQREGDTTTIIVDTTNGHPDDPTMHKDIYLRLLPNCKQSYNPWEYDPNSSAKDTFMWKYGGRKLNVLVRGAGSAVFFLDDRKGVSVAKYSDIDKKVFIGHEAFFNEIGNDFSEGDISAAEMLRQEVSKYIHGETLCDIEDCVYCHDLVKPDKSNVGIEISPGAHLIRQDGDETLGKWGTRLGGLIEKYMSSSGGYIGADNNPHPYFIHNNVFMVNNNDYNRKPVTDTGTQDGYDVRNVFFYKDTKMYGYIWSNYSIVETREYGNCFMAGGIVGSSFAMSNRLAGDYTSGNLEVAHLMPADYYALTKKKQIWQPEKYELDGITERADYNPLTYSRNVVASLLGEVSSSGEGGMATITLPGGAESSFGSIGFR